MTAAIEILFVAVPVKINFLGPLVIVATNRNPVVRAYGHGEWEGERSSAQKEEKAC